MPTPLITLLIAVLGYMAVLASPAFAVGSDESSSAASSGYAEAKAMVDAGNYPAAMHALLAVTSEDRRNADAWNLLGFTHRKLGQMDDSAAAYLNVLSINPDHLGALEYQGELFLQTGHPDLAKANLTRLQGLCGTCEEAEDLAQAIQAAGV